MSVLLTKMPQMQDQKTWRNPCSQLCLQDTGGMGSADTVLFMEGREVGQKDLFFRNIGYLSVFHQLSNCIFRSHDFPRCCG